MFLFVFAGTREEMVKFQSFSFWFVPANWRVDTFSLKNVPKSAGDSGVFLIYFAVLSLVFE